MSMKMGSEKKEGDISIKPAEGGGEKMERALE